MAKRDENGRFVKGVSGNPNGRPPKRREERYLEITLNTVTFGDWKEIIKRAAMEAKRGDAQARKWLSDYLLGPAKERLDITTDDESLNDGGILTDKQRIALLSALLEEDEEETS